MNSRIFLIGAMGSGKTTIGNILSEALAIDYIDNDYGLSKMISKSVNELAELDIDELHERENQYAAQLFMQSGPFIAGVSASIGDNFELSEKLKGECTIYLHTSLADQILHSGRRGVGRQGFLENREAEIQSRYERRDPRFREISCFVVNATRDRKKDANSILEYLNSK